MLPLGLGNVFKQLLGKIEINGQKIDKDQKVVIEVDAVTGDVTIKIPLSLAFSVSWHARGLFSLPRPLQAMSLEPGARMEARMLSH